MAEKPNIKKTIIQFIVLIALIAVTFFVIFKLSGDFSFAKWFDFIAQLSLPFVLLALFLMLMNIVFKGLALGSISKSCGYKNSFISNVSYSSADLYFSAITPSATGGQPACLYFMVKDGMPVSVATAVISFNLFIYTGSLVVLGVIAFILFPQAFSMFNVPSKVLVLFGFITQSLGLLFYVAILVSERLVLAIGRFLVKILCAIRIFKDKEKSYARVEGFVKRFRKEIFFINNNKGIWLKAFLYNMGERIAYVLIAVLIFYGHPELMAQNQCTPIQIFALESFALLAAYSIPLPGSVGGAEAAFLWIFSIAIPSNLTALNATMFTTRGITFYLMFIVAGIFILTYHLVKNVFGKNRNSKHTGLTDLMKKEEKNN